MATHDERRALLAVPCPWCGASRGQPCEVRQTGKTARVKNDDGTAETVARPADRGRGHHRRITTLDAGCHNARWKAALGVEAPVVVPVPEIPEPSRMVGAGLGERPW